MSLNIQQKDILILAKRVRTMNQYNTNPSLNDDEREKKLISLAYDHAEEQFRNGTASSQLTTHFLKYGSKKAELELKYAELQNQFLQERIATERSSAEINQLFIQVMEALTSYQGRPEEEFYAND
jgi:hypothetical protein